MTLLGALTQLAIAAGTAAVEAAAKLLRRRPVEREPEPEHVSWKGLELQREQERRATAHKVKRP